MLEDGAYKLIGRLTGGHPDTLTMLRSTRRITWGTTRKASNCRTRRNSARSSAQYRYPTVNKSAPLSYVTNSQYGLREAPSHAQPPRPPKESYSSQYYESSPQLPAKEPINNHRSLAAGRHKYLLHLVSRFCSTLHDHNTLCASNLSGYSIN